MRRQPFGGWKQASVGGGAKAGGPNYLIGFGSWHDAPESAVGLPQASGDPVTDAALAAAEQVGVDQSAVEWLRVALTTDVQAWDLEFRARDITGLSVETNLLRYRPVPVTVRVENATHAQLLRVVAAGSRARAHVTVSTREPLAGPLQRYLDQLGFSTHVENLVQWGARAAQLAAGGGRVRLLGGSTVELAAMVAGSPALAIYGGDVVTAGRVELLTFLHEQAVSITAQRFGTPRAYELEPERRRASAASARSA